jgi:uncharacterized tellurite resistance protein B-like protein
MASLLKAFAITHFESIFTKMNEDNQKEFLNMLMAVVHSHRHNKEDHVNDKDEEELGVSHLDFSLVRDTMYKYSKQA